MMRGIATTTTATAAAAAALLAALCLAPAAHAEQDRKGSLIASFHGGISPRRLPRAGTAPVSVQMGGRIATADRSTPPKLQRIVLEINRNGKIDTAGLPTCPLRKLSSISSSGARRACAGALIGHGNVTSRVALPGQGAFASNGPLLAFNGRYRGRQAVFAQVASQAPLPLTYVIVFAVRRAKGAYGTALVADLPPIASEYGYISAFDLSLGRRYSYRGARHSFASASCPAPAGFPGAVFPLARASYRFAGGISLSSTLVRECKARGK